MQDLTGQKFNCLTVTGLEKTPAGSMWLCDCSCGKAAYANTYDLIHDKKKSCGHLRTEHNRRYAEKFIKNKQKISLPNAIARGVHNWCVDDSLDELSGIT